MSDATLRIKNLSIALEALSRIPNTGEFSSNIEKILREEIRELKVEKEKENQWPQQRPAKSTIHGDREYPDEDLPF